MSQSDVVKAFYEDADEEARERAEEAARDLPGGTDPERWERAERAALETFRRAAELGDLAPVLAEGSFLEMAPLYAQLTDAIDHLTSAKQVIADGMGAIMERRIEPVDGLGAFERTPRKSERWDNEEVRRFARLRALGTAATPEGEVPPEMVEAIDRALEVITDIFSLSSPKAGGLTKYGASPDEYRETDVRGWNVKWTPSASAREAF